MDSSRVSFGETVAGAGALVLLVVMFFPWYGATATVAGGQTQGASANAWDSFSIIDILLFLVVVITIGLVVARAAGSMPSGLPASPGLIVAGAGAVAILLILFRLLNVPGENVVGFGVQVEVGRKIGIFLALLASIAIAYGGYTGANERKSGDFTTEEE